MRTSYGFTLIELMITTAIVALLAFFAVPSYRDYQRHSQATAGVAELAAFRPRMETYYQDHRSYGAPQDPVTAQHSVTSPSCGVAMPANPRFTFTCSTSSQGQAYVLIATGIAGPVAGSTYRIDQTGLQTTTMFRGKTVARNCWLLRGTECRNTSDSGNSLALASPDSTDLSAAQR